MGSDATVAEEQLIARIEATIADLWALRTDEPLPKFDADTNLFDADVVDSFSMLEVISEVEELLGQPIDLLEVDPEEFFTIRGIVAYFRSRQQPRS